VTTFHLAWTLASVQRLVSDSFATCCCSMERKTVCFSNSEVCHLVFRNHLASSASTLAKSVISPYNKLESDITYIDK